MVDLKEIIKCQRNFDKKLGWYWNSSTDEEKIKYLQYSVIALAEEVGEFAGVVKKILREHGTLKKLPEKKIKKLREELIDIFIYIIKVGDQVLAMDIEKEFFKKLKTNEERFKIQNTKIPST